MGLFNRKPRTLADMEADLAHAEEKARQAEAALVKYLNRPGMFRNDDRADVLKKQKKDAHERVKAIRDEITGRQQR